MNAISNLNDELRTRAQDLVSAMLADLSGVSTVLVATADGFELAAALRQRDEDPGRIAAMASSIAAISAVVAAEAGLGNYKSVTINAEQGFAVVVAVPRTDIELIINVIANSDAVLALVLHRANSMAKQLAA